MEPGSAQPDDGSADGVTPLPKRTDMHYDSTVFEHVDWSKRGAYMEKRHGITPQIANDALDDANRVVIDPDYNSTMAAASASSGSRS